MAADTESYDQQMAKSCSCYAEVEQTRLEQLRHLKTMIAGMGDDSFRSLLPAGSASLTAQGFALELATITQHQVALAELIALIKNRHDAVRRTGANHE